MLFTKASGFSTESSRCSGAILLEIVMASNESANTLGKVAATLADGEGLQAHAESARYRIDN